ncbi:MAG: hypothetical protein FJZ47_10550 [Candidatus Tectomicrobia bacterium]|uniref:Copper resistance protein D domain-containing protein n=1 Tax=Tectimicrobiota bacterium TaxID=2528274 RepID=A0A937W2I7_UNCTE|nr:hypothetical protein [Candidatus Tectomicrobia bacterium]
MRTAILVLHTLTMVVVLGGYIFLSLFWWPVLQRTLTDGPVLLRCLSQTLRRFFTVVLLALTLALMTGGLYLLPDARLMRASSEAALNDFYIVLGLKLAAVFLVMLLVPMQLFGMAFRLTRMDAGIYPYDATVVQRVSQRMQTVSYLIIILLTLVLILSMQL